MPCLFFEAGGVHMSLLNTFDPNSEELIKVNMQRSFHEVEDFPEIVIGTFNTIL